MTKTPAETKAAIRKDYRTDIDLLSFYIRTTNNKKKIRALRRLREVIEAWEKALAPDRSRKDE